MQIRETRESYGTNGGNLGRGGVAADADDLQLQWERWCIKEAWWRLHRCRRSRRRVSKTTDMWRETDNSCKTSLFNLQADTVRCFSILMRSFVLLASLICSYVYDRVSQWCVWPMTIAGVGSVSTVNDSWKLPHRWEWSEEVSMTSIHL